MRANAASARMNSMAMTDRPEDERLDEERYMDCLLLNKAVSFAGTEPGLAAPPAGAAKGIFRILGVQVKALRARFFFLPGRTRTIFRSRKKTSGA